MKKIRIVPRRAAPYPPPAGDTIVIHEHHDGCLKGCGCLVCVALLIGGAAFYLLGRSVLSLVDKQIAAEKSAEASHTRSYSYVGDPKLESRVRANFERALGTDIGRIRQVSHPNGLLFIHEESSAFYFPTNVPKTSAKWLYIPPEKYGDFDKLFSSIREHYASKNSEGKSDNFKKKYGGQK